MKTEISPARRKHRAEARKRQEEYWKRKCGPVTVRFVEPEPRKMQGKRTGR